MSLFPSVQQFFRRLFRRGPAEPLDPYARVRVPVRRGPPLRGSAVAVEEPGEPKRLNLLGRWSPRAPR